ncbi:MAG: TlpA family protein disulfide reductase [Desulfobacula sp.]|nr:TlpA family protein disulfide reductase [Desulfobacula sp.]
MKKRYTIIMWLATLLLLISGTGYAAHVGDLAPQFQIRTLSNKVVDSGTLKGKKSMALIFWATWCPECKKEIPDIIQLHREFEPKGMEILAVDVGINDSKAKVKKYIEKYKVSYPVAFDQGAQITKKFNIQGTPTIIIVDKNGVIRYRGTHIPDDLAAHYSQLMEDEE